MRCYAIKDVVANEFGPIFYAKNDDVALRQYNQLQQKNEFVVDEYKLYFLGAIDDDKGIINVPNSPVEITPEKVLKEM